MISIKHFAGKRRKVVKKPPVKILDDFLSPGEFIKKGSKCPIWIFKVASKKIYFYLFSKAIELLLFLFHINFNFIVYGLRREGSVET